MLYWALVFFLLTLIAAVMGFGNVVAVGDPAVARMLFFVFLVIFVITLLLGVFREQPREL